MPWTSEHIAWLNDTGERLTTSDGKTVEVWEFCHQEDDVVLSVWAKHFRNHYCRDTEIDYLRRGYGYSRQKYLNKIKFPNSSKPPGPSIRAGDFGEILVADYLEFVLGYWVPRMRYGCKSISNESTKGCDTIGFRFFDQEESPNDILAIFEAKTRFSRSSNKNRLQDAVNGSIKDRIRKDESLNYIKQRLYEKGRQEDSIKIERFQNPVDKPYNERSGAAALFSSHLFDANIVSETTTSEHTNQSNLFLIVIKGENMMNLVNDLYRRAADEA